MLGNRTGTPFGDTGVVLRLAPGPSLCGPAPLPAESCRQAAAGKSSLRIVDRARDAKDKLAWDWQKGDATSVADFADPVGGAAASSFCVYDSSASTQPLAELPLRVGGTCGSKPCWTPIGPARKPRGFSFKNKAADPDGIRSVKLEAGGTGKARVQITGKGEKLTVPTLPLVPPVTVQLVIDGGTTSACWQAEYTTANRNTGTAFKVIGQRRKSAPPPEPGYSASR